MLCSIRPMRRGDLAQVTEIDREAFPTQWPPANYKHELDNQLARYIVACDESENREASRESKPQGFTARVAQWFRHRIPGRAEKPPTEEQNIIGFAGIWVLADESHITNIAVRKSHLRRGIGELLLIHLIELSRKLKADIMTLEVRASNASAQSLYIKYGFTQVGLRRAYYTDNREDGMLMSTETINSESYQALFQQLKQAYASKWDYLLPQG